MTSVMEAMGLAPEATEDEALGAIDALVTRREEALDALRTVWDAMGAAPETSATDIADAVRALIDTASRAQALGARVAELEARIRETEAEVLVDQAMKDGKLVPGQRQWAMAYAMADPGEFTAFADKAPVVVPVGELRFTPPKSAARIDGPQAEVNRCLGISDETHRKHHRA